MNENLPKIVCNVAEVIASAIPLKILVLAREVIKDGALKTIEVKPTKESHKIAIRIPHGTTTYMGTAALIIMAIVEADKPIIAPTDMSKLPEIIMIAAPDATTPRVEICSNMLIMLASLKNLGFAIPVIIDMAIITNNSVNHCECKILLHFPFFMLTPIKRL
jgi:hypothetical protein